VVIVAMAKGNNVNFSRTERPMKWLAGCLAAACLWFGGIGPGVAGETVLRYFPSGPIYEYRWKLLELALAHVKAEAGSFRLEPYAEEVTQNRGVLLLQSTCHRQFSPSPSKP